MDDKRIDEKWKETVDKEKKRRPEGGEGQTPLEANFTNFISSLAMEALVFLGEIANPVTKKKQENLDQARYVIDILGLLKEKTKGNLSAEEANAVDNLLYELRSKFIAKNG
jgi:hypothetical protein